ncbi:MAG: tripartite tricarboxylate transporter TctB family protein [Geminicoccaceae bacterium]|nr:tripartite tricarboxylate transporter TctB family protein [Geminicoccaceae bacterium]HRY25377.1 tripartite tricarboxylate transporter TctB family protein [Geminicoccaceae bacterium]
MQDRVDPRVEIGVALMVIVIAAIALFETRDIPPGSFEPLGSAPVPQATAGLIILMALGLIVRACLDRRPVARPPREGLADAGAVLLLTLLYVTAMHYRLTTFAVMTTIYLVLTIGTLIRFRPRSMPLVLALAAVVGFGSQYVFTRVFVVDLPGL